MIFFFFLIDNLIIKFILVKILDKYFNILIIILKKFE
jgi:hypothetical protein